MPFRFISQAISVEARRQLAQEIEAQFAAFARTGLPLDHVNAHKHFHLHPVITSLLLRIGPRYGMKALRAPVEPGAPLSLHEPVRPRIETPWARLVRWRLRRAGLIIPDAVFGLRWSGAMDEARLAHILAALPSGLSEIYLHVATGPYSEGEPSYRYAEELSAVLSPRMKAITRQNAIKLETFERSAIHSTT